jgi:hypothetical protein
VQPATSTPTSLAELAMRFASAGISLAQQATAQAVSAAQQASGADGGADGSAPTTGTGIEGFIGHFLPGHG